VKFTSKIELRVTSIKPNDNKKIRFVHKKANNSLIKRIEDLNLNSIGITIEYPAEALKFHEAIAKKINKFDAVEKIIKLCHFELSGKS